MSIAAVVRAMANAGATAEAIAIAVEALEASEAKSRRAANRRAYLKRVGGTELSTETPTETYLKPTETPTEKTEIEPSRIHARVLCGEEVIEDKKDISSLRSDKIPNPKSRTDLQIAVGDELAAAIIAHRKAMRKPLIPLAASRLAKQFLETGHPQDAARMMIDKGWQGFNAAWFAKAREGPDMFTAAGKPRDSPLSFAERMEKFVNRGSQNDQDDSRRPPIIDGDVFVLSGSGERGR